MTSNNKSKDKATNPKDLIGQLKPDMTNIPMSALVMVAVCMAYGAKKYSPYNWRDPNKKVGVKTYLAAAMRHLMAYADGEDLAEDSGITHIDHVISGLMVLRDAQLCGTAVDDRNIKGVAGKLIDQNTKKVNKVPDQETWLYENPEALTMVQQGLETAKKGEGDTLPWELCDDDKWIEIGYE